MAAPRSAPAASLEGEAKPDDIRRTPGTSACVIKHPAIFPRRIVEHFIDLTTDEGNAQLRASLERSGLEAEQAAREVESAVDRTVYYAGFCDKYQALVASLNPVAGPYFAFSVPEPMGVVAVVAPERPALLGLVSTVLPAAAGGNTCVVVAGSEDARTAVLWCECLATSDLPGGVVNVLTGRAAELALHLAGHREVSAVDAWSDDAALAAAVEREGSGNVKRVATHGPEEARALASAAGQGLGFIERFLETKTVWHPVGA